MRDMPVLGIGPEGVMPLPREHGAYLQIALPIATSLTVAGVAMPPL